MRIGIVGGLDRSEQSFERLARDHGHEVEHHDGDMRGTASAALAGLVERADLVVIVTDINSHNAVRAARRLLRARGRSPVIVRRLGVSSFVALMHTHTPPRARQPRQTHGRTAHGHAQITSQ